MGSKTKLDSAWVSAAVFGVLCAFWPTTAWSAGWWAPHVFAIGGFGLALSLLTSRWLLRAKLLSEPTYEAHIGVIAFCVVWGRTTFIGRFFHDEIGYFLPQHENLSVTLRWLAEPLNEHFQPLFKLVTWLVYQAWGTHYAGTALLSFVSFILCIHGVCALLQATNIAATARMLAAGLFAIWPRFGDVMAWKAAGIPLFLSCSAFLLWLSWVVRAMSEPANVRLTWRSALPLAVTVFSSSLITLPAVYLAPFPGLALRRGAAARPFAIALGLACGASAAYFALRNWVFAIPLETHPVTLASVQTRVGQFVQMDVAQALSSLSPTSVGLVFSVPLFASAAGLALTLLLRRTPDRALMVATLGGLFIAISLAQVVAGRGVVARLADIMERHHFLATVGFVLCLAAALDALLRALPHSSAFRLRWSPLFLAIPVTINALETQRSLPSSEIAQITAQRSAFFEDVDAMMCAIQRALTSRRRIDHHAVLLPDCQVQGSPAAQALAVEFPFSSSRYGYSLEFFASLAESGCRETTMIRFVPAELLPAQAMTEVFALPEVATFYEKYFAFVPGKPR